MTRKSRLCHTIGGTAGTHRHQLEPLQNTKLKALDIRRDRRPISSAFLRANRIGRWPSEKGE